MKASTKSQAHVNWPAEIAIALSEERQTGKLVCHLCGHHFVTTGIEAGWLYYYFPHDQTITYSNQKVIDTLIKEHQKDCPQVPQGAQIPLFREPRF